jgi:hypothetical protein
VLNSPEESSCSRREIGRGVAKARVESDPGPGDDTPTFTREQLAEAWGIDE